jgi:hypothetical protein
MTLALDGTPVGGIISGAATTTVVSGALTTTASSGVVIALVGINNESNVQVTVGSVAGAGLTWTKRAQQFFLDSGNFQYVDYEIWWAPYSSPISAQAITATFASAATSVGAIISVFAVSGANTSTPFDPVSTSFKTNTTATADTPQTTITTTNANDFIFAGIFNGSGVPTTWTTQASFTTLGNINGFSGSPNFTQAYTQAEYQIVSSTQSGLTIGFTDASHTYILLADAIKAAGTVDTLFIGNGVIFM